MESASQLGTYLAYFFVCVFLLVVCVAAARSYGMIMSLVLMVFMGNTKPEKEYIPVSDPDTLPMKRRGEAGGENIRAEIPSD